MYEILSNRSVLFVKGDEASKFLQNLITNDIMTKDSCYSYMLSNQGRYLFDFFISKISSKEFLIDISSNFISQFIQKLNIYKFRAAIEFIDLSDDYQVLYSKDDLKINSVISFRDTRYSKLGIRTVIKKTNLSEIKGQLATGLYYTDKYNFAIPDGEIDLIAEKSIPLEYGAEELGAISYTKGCYIGQELMSRTKYQGVIRKKIFRISGQNELKNISSSDEVIVNGEKIGVFCSVYLNQAIALIKEEKYNLIGKEVVSVGDNKVIISLPEWRVVNV